MPITLEYPITRSFRWRWFTVSSIVGGTIIFGFLIVLNIPLTGYETITVFQNDFNATQTKWFDPLMPFRKPKPGSLCDAHVLNDGDTFRTNYSFFKWTVDTINPSITMSSGIPYHGNPLRFCDVTSVNLDGDMPARRLDLSVISTCTGMRTRDDGRGVILEYIMRAAAKDVSDSATIALLASNVTTPVAFSLRAEISWCPLNFGPQAPCSTQVPQIGIREGEAIYSNSTVYLTTDDLPLFLGDLRLPLSNLFQAVYAAVRIDWGNDSSNNFILNRDVTNATLATAFPISGAWFPSMLSYEWNQPYPFFKFPHPPTPYRPFRIGGPASIQVVYLCRFQKLKSLGSLIASVLVATLSMFSSIWAIFMTVAAAIARKGDPTANHCNGHVQYNMGTEPNWFDTIKGYAYLPETKLIPNDVEYQPLARVVETTITSSIKPTRRKHLMANAVASQMATGLP